MLRGLLKVVISVKFLTQQPQALKATMIHKLPKGGGVCKGLLIYSLDWVGGKASSFLDVSARLFSPKAK